ncbi:MAG: hypothetical protein WAW96_14425 [Alphaproteobacteria bacterium]
MADNARKKISTQIRTRSIGVPSEFSILLILSPIVHLLAIALLGIASALAVSIIYIFIGSALGAVIGYGAEQLLKKIGYSLEQLPKISKEEGSPTPISIAFMALGGFLGLIFFFTQGTATESFKFGFLYSPTLIFLLLMVGVIAVRSFETITNSNIIFAFKLPSIVRSKVTPTSIKIPLSFFLYYSLLSVGVAFFLAVKITGIYHEFLPGMEKQINTGSQNLSEEFGLLAHTLSPLLSPQRSIALAFMAGLLWTFWVHLGLNWIVSQSLWKAISVFLTAFFLNLVYLLVSYLLFRFLPGHQYLTDFVFFLNEVLRGAFRSTLSYLASIWRIDSDILHTLSQISTYIADVLSVLVRISARLVMFPEALAKVLQDIIHFIDRYNSTYFFFVVASALLWWRVARRELDAARRAMNADAYGPIRYTRWLSLLMRVTLFCLVLLMLFAGPGAFWILLLFVAILGLLVFFFPPLDWPTGPADEN